MVFSQFANEKLSFDFYNIIKEIFSPRDNVWGHFWFLPTLLIIYMLSYLLLKAYNSKILNALIIAITVGLAVFPINIDWFSIKDVCCELLYFCIGLCTCDLIIKHKDNIFKWYISALLLIFSIAVYIAFLNSRFKYNNAVKNTCGIVVALFMIYVVLSVSYFFEKRGSKFLDFFDGKTFTIYIISWPCQSVVEILLNRVLHLPWYIVVLSMFTVGLGIPLLFITVYRRLKHHPKFINLVFGV